MINRIYDALYIFFIVIEMILFLYVITSWFPINNRFKNLICFLIDPILVPVRYLLKHSIFNTPTADLSPVIGFVIILFLQEFFYILK
ncbi:YggT family protein [Anaerocolumna sedimenticola]|uniref:YggT family protein n=1 Tax=Anaerocolumna sedimenticola TaxID=2696063 RepID=A0A6P1TS55_9FIRM|nr:YggT family protein [Anaerocolumna sedimenticola]